MICGVILSEIKNAGHEETGKRNVVPDEKTKKSNQEPFPGLMQEEEWRWFDILNDGGSP